MILKATLFASWVSATSAFSPVVSFNAQRTSLRHTNAKTPAPITTALYATIANSTDLLSPNYVSSKDRAASETTVAAVPKMAQRWRKSTKQLATLGPASESKEMIEKLFLAGADVFRLNFSHGSQEQKKELLIMIRVSQSQVVLLYMSILPRR